MSSSPSKRPRLDGASLGSSSSSSVLASDTLVAASALRQCFFHVIFLVDASGSMALEAGGTRGQRGMNRLGAVFDSIELFMGMMMGMTDMLCSLATFNDTHDVKLKAEKPNAKLVKKLRDIKATTNPEGGGFYVEALKAMQKLSTNAVDIGVLLSDGCPSEMLVRRDSSPIDRYMEKMHAEMDSKWFLHTVGFGAFDTRCLQNLARQGKGAFHVNERLDIAELRRIFAQLSTSVSTLRRTVLTFGEAALTPLPQRDLEPEGAWKAATAEQLRDMADAQWAWIMLPREAEGESGKKDLQPQGNARMVRVHKKPFAQGALRYAFHLFLGEQGSKETALHLVAKESKFEMGSKTPQAVHTAFLDNHRRAEELAKAFNSNIQLNDTALGDGDAEAKPQSPKVQFVPAYVIQISETSASTGFRYVTAERYIPGRYVKFNGNDGYVDEDVDAEIGGTVAAFSHFTFDHTDGQELCVDVQGVGCTWTDPQLHTRPKSFGPADLGEEGMRRFFRSHNCSELCYRMQLRRVDTEELTLGEPLDPEDPRLQKKACLVCLDGERVAVCQPCGHLCFCAECIADGTVFSVTACPVCRKRIDSTTTLRPRFRPPSTFVKEVAMRGRATPASAS